MDSSPAVREVAAFRVATLLAKYPQQLQHEACRQAFTFWPQDIYRVQQQHLRQLQGLGGPYVLWAGWECQDLSPAGTGRGLSGPCSSTFNPLRDLLQTLQGLVGPTSLAWVLENTAMDVPWQKGQRVLEDLRDIKGVLRAAAAGCIPAWVQGSPAQVLLDQPGPTGGAAAGDSAGPAASRDHGGAGAGPWQGSQGSAS